MLRLLAGENFNGDVVRALLLRQPDLDIVRVQDVGLAGESTAGVFILNDRFPVGHATDELLLIIACSEQQEWRDRVVHLPL